MLIIYLDAVTSYITHALSTLIMGPVLDQTRNQFTIECSIPCIIFYFLKSSRIWRMFLENVPNSRYIMYAMLHILYTQFRMEHVGENQLAQLFNIQINHIFNQFIIRL